METNERTSADDPSTGVVMSRRALFSRTLMAAGATVGLLGLTGCPGGEGDDDDDGEDDDD